MDIRSYISPQIFAAALRPAITGTLALVLGAAAADAAELRVVSRPDMVRMLTALAPQIEEFTETTLVVDIAKHGAYGRRLAEPFDVTLVDEATAETLLKQGKVAAGGLSCIAWTGLGMAVRAGSTARDIGTVDGLRRTLLAARSIAFSGDERSGAQFRSVLVRLGIADRVEARLIDTGNRRPLQLVTHGGVDLAIALQSEITAASGVQSLGRLPPEVQYPTPMFAVVSSEAAAPIAARRLIAFLGSSDAVLALHAIGLDTAVSE